MRVRMPFFAGSCSCRIIFFPGCPNALKVQNSFQPCRGRFIRFLSLHFLPEFGTYYCLLLLACPPVSPGDLVDLLGADHFMGPKMVDCGSRLLYYGNIQPVLHMYVYAIPGVWSSSSFRAKAVVRSRHGLWPGVPGYGRISAYERRHDQLQSATWE